MNFETGGLTLADSPTHISVALKTDFPYEDIYDRMDGPSALSHAHDADARAGEALCKVMEWVFQPPCKNVDGFVCRSIVASWVFVPQLHEHSMADMARRFGKQKQSLGRWVTDFKQEFPVVAKHLQHLRH